MGLYKCVSSGGTQVKIDTVTLSTSTTTTVTLGFQPKYVAYIQASSSNTDATLAHVGFYDEDYSTTKFAHAASGAYLGRENFNTTSVGYINSITSTGFIMNKGKSGYLVCYYVAIG